MFSATTECFPPWELRPGIFFLEVFRRSLKNLYNVIGNLRCLRHCECFHLDISQLLIIKVALFLDTLNLLKESLVLE